MLALLLAPEQVLANYTQALDALKPPAAYIFEYTFAHHGSHPQETEHRIFRQGTHERDEIVAFNSEKLPHPMIRVFAGHHDPYDVAALAPRTDVNAFTFEGEGKQGRNLVYVFNVYARGTPKYEVTRMVIDGKSFLPLQLDYRTTTGNVVGTGTVTFARTDRYWMPQSVTARADVRGDLQTERIDWSRYQFYPNLPPSTFVMPRAPQVTPPAG
ncbi:MAG TPA: hypothetical protein VGG22_08665 [Candidatus Baltobacteraceae bacterium]